jgi:hypothetical protein
VRRPVVRLSSPRYRHAEARTFLPRGAGAARRPLLLAWAYVGAAGSTPEHYVALQRRSSSAGRLALPPALQPPTWPQNARADASRVDWSNVAPLPACAPPPGGPLSAHGFTSGAACAALVDSLGAAAAAELDALLPGGAVLRCARAPHGEGLVALDTLLRLFYIACGLEAAVSAGQAVPPEAVNAALTAPADGSVRARVAAATTAALGRPWMAELPNAAAALAARVWYLGHERHMYLAACACVASGDEAALAAQRTAQQRAAAAAQAYERRLPPEDAAPDAWQAHYRSVATRVAQLGRTDCPPIVPPAPPAAQSLPAAPTQPLGPSASLALTQDPTVPAAARMAAARGSRLLQERCAQVGVPYVGALTDEAVDAVVRTLCTVPEDRALSCVADALRMHGYNTAWLP